MNSAGSGVLRAVWAGIWGQDVNTAQISLPARLGGMGSHLVSDRYGAACDTAFFAPSATTNRAVSGGSGHFDLFKDASDDDLAGLLLTCTAGFNSS